MTVAINMPAMSDLDLLSNFDLTPVKRYTFKLSPDERPLNIFYKEQVLVIDHNKQRAQEIVLSLVDEYNSYFGLVFNHIFQSQPPVIPR